MCFFQHVGKSFIAEKLRTFDPSGGRYSLLRTVDKSLPVVIVIQDFLLSVLPLLHVDDTHLELGLDEHLTKIHQLLVSGVW